MIDRKLSFVLRNGELSIEKTEENSYKYVGGSPITINTNGNVSGNVGPYSFNGISWNSYDTDKEGNGLCTFILPPAIVTLKREPDGTAPWKAGRTYAVGDLLRPTVSTGTPSYAVWTNEPYDNKVTHAQYVYPAKIIAIEGSASSPTAITILLTYCFEEG